MENKVGVAKWSRLVAGARATQSSFEQRKKTIQAKQASGMPNVRTEFSYLAIDNLLEERDHFLLAYIRAQPHPAPANHHALPFLVNAVYLDALQSTCLPHCEHIQACAHRSHTTLHRKSLSGPPKASLLFLSC